MPVLSHPVSKQFRVASATTRPGCSNDPSVFLPRHTKQVTI